MAEPNILSMQGPVCPLPITDFDVIVMGHGSGGLMTNELIKTVFLPHFNNPALLAGNDFAEIPGKHTGRLVVSTDAHIVSPLFFPGGNIGQLAVAGTINDIAVSGGTPLCLTAGFIIQLITVVFPRIVRSGDHDAAKTVQIPNSEGQLRRWPQCFKNIAGNPMAR